MKFLAKYLAGLLLVSGLIAFFWGGFDYWFLGNSYVDVIIVASALVTMMVASAIWTVMDALPHQQPITAGVPPQPKETGATDDSAGRNDMRILSASGSLRR
jgi:hypothetical protein